MRPIRIGMVGYGGIGRVHVLGYRALLSNYALPARTVHIVGVATSQPESARKAAEEIGCDVWTDDFRTLISRDDIDVIDCCTPNRMHEAVLVAGAAAGKHLYCEKPLSLGMADAVRILAAARAADVHTQLTFNFRFFPAIQRAKQLMQSGFVGRVFSFRGRYYRSSYIDASKPTSWRLQKAESGGGALVDLGSHVLDLLYFLLGDFGSLNATLDTLIRERPVAAGSAEKVPVDVDDIAFIHARMADGTLGLVEVSRMGTGSTNELVIEIYGDRGALRFSSLDPNWLEVYDAQDPASPSGGMRGFRRVETAGRFEGAKAPDWTMPVDFVRTHSECQYQFLRALEAGRPPSPSFADGLHVQAVMEAALQSSAQARWVSIREVLEQFPN